MGTDTGLGRRAGTVARWPVGMGLAFWRYLWRTLPLHRSDTDGSPDQDLPPPLPEELVDGRVQLPEDGSGPLFRRRYRVRIEGSRLTPEQLMGEMLREPNRAAPIEVAVFRKTRGGEGPLAVGDEFVVRMPGPWAAPGPAGPWRPCATRPSTSTPTSTSTSRPPTAGRSTTTSSRSRPSRPARRAQGAALSSPSA
jgi:hypothetical protein